MCIYIYIYTLNNRFLGNLFFKPLDKLLGGDFPKSCETFLVLCWGGRWEFHVWIPPSLLQHYPNLQNCTANQETPKKTFCFTLQSHGAIKHKHPVPPLALSSRFETNEPGWTAGICYQENPKSIFSLPSRCI